MSRPRSRRLLTQGERQLFQGLVSHIPYIRMARLFGIEEARLHQLLKRHEGEALDAQAVWKQGSRTPSAGA